MVLQYASAGKLPGVVINVSNPYGPRDWQPSQGLMVAMAAFGKIPVYVKGVATEVVGVEDAAAAFLLAGDRGRVGERYIVSESYMSMREMFETAATAVGAKPPRFGVPLAALYAVGYASSILSTTFAARFSDERDRGSAVTHDVARGPRQGDARTRMGAPSDRRIDPPRSAVLRRAGPGHGFKRRTSL